MPSPPPATAGPEQEFLRLVESVADAWVAVAEASTTAGRLPRAESAVRVVGHLLGEASASGAPVAVSTVASARATAERVAGVLSDTGEAERALAMGRAAEGLGRGWDR